MQIAVVLLSLFCFLPSSAWCAPGKRAAPPTASTKGWKLSQFHGFQNGSTVYLTSHAIRIDNDNAGWSMVSQAPKWDAIVFSHVDKTYAIVPYARWSKGGFDLFCVAEEPVVVPKRTTSLRGEFKVPSFGVLPCTIYRWTGKPPDAGSMMFRTEEGKQKCLYNLFITKEIPATKEAEELLGQYYQMGTCDGVAIRFTSTVNKRPILDTMRVDATEFASDVFILPKGYKLMKKEADVYLNAKDRSKIDDFGQLIGK